MDVYREIYLNLKKLTLMIESAADPKPPSAADTRRCRPLLYSSGIPPKWYAMRIKKSVLKGTDWVQIRFFSIGGALMRASGGVYRAVECRIRILHKPQEHEYFILDPRFSVNIAYMDLYGTDAYRKPVGDLLIAAAATDELSDLQFPRGYPVPLLQVVPAGLVEQYDPRLLHGGGGTALIRFPGRFRH